MGTGTSKQSKKEIHKKPNIKKLNNLKIYKHKTDGRQGEQYNFVLDNRYSAKSQEQIYEFRNKTSSPLIRVFEHQFQPKSKKLVSHNFFRVITQRIPLRLSESPQLTFQQCLYIFDSCLNGYNSLYHHVGGFDINSKMIGFTLSGQLKVWFNQNFGLNYPEHEKGTLQATRLDQSHRYDQEYTQIEQVQLVRNIVNVVQDKCQQGQFPELFRSKARQRIGFRQAKNIVEEQYSNTNIIRLNKVDLFENKIRSKINVMKHSIMYDTSDSLRYTQSARRSTGTKYQVMSMSVPIEKRQLEKQK